MELAAPESAGGTAHFQVPTGSPFHSFNKIFRTPNSVPSTMLGAAQGIAMKQAGIIPILMEFTDRRRQHVSKTNMKAQTRFSSPRTGDTSQGEGVTGERSRCRDSDSVLLGRWTQHLGMMYPCRHGNHLGPRIPHPPAVHLWATLFTSLSLSAPLP